MNKFNHLQEIIIENADILAVAENRLHDYSTAFNE